MKMVWLNWWAGSSCVDLIPRWLHVVKMLGGFTIFFASDRTEQPLKCNDHNKNQVVFKGLKHMILFIFEGRRQADVMCIPVQNTAGDDNWISYKTTVHNNHISLWVLYTNKKTQWTNLTLCTKGKSCTNNNNKSIALKLLCLLACLLFFQACTVFRMLGKNENSCENCNIQIGSA